MPDEHQLIAQAQAGDRNALNELVAVFWQPVYRYISYKTGSPEDAKEITQETFIRAVQALPAYQDIGIAFITYLKRIASNLITDFWRKNGRSPVFIDLDEKRQATETDQPDNIAVDQEMRQAIAGVLNELPEEQRLTIELRIIAGLPIRDTAAAMDKTPAAVKMLQQRALKNLRTLLLTRGIIEQTGRR